MYKKELAYLYMMRYSLSMKQKITSEKIEFHPDLGVHKTYKGFKWQPGYSEVSYIRPGARQFRIFWGSREEFFKAVDKGVL